MTPEGERLNRHLNQSIAELSIRTVERATTMPELGGKALADQVRTGLAGIKKSLDDLKTESAAAVMELSAEVENGKEGVKRMRAESAAVRAAFAEILGNEGSTSSDTTDQK